MIPTRGPDLYLLPHRLTIVVDGDGEKDWAVEHHEACPVVCNWSPWYSDYWNNRDGDARTSINGAAWDWESISDEGHHSCYVQYELDGNGIDSLDADSLDGDAHIDQGREPASRWEADWYRLRTGVYVIEGWFTPSGWAGSEPIDADGGLTILEYHAGPVE